MSNIGENRGRSSRWLKWGMAGLVIACGAVFLALRGRATQGDVAASDKALVEVAQGPLTISVTESGAIQPLEQIILKSEVEGSTTILFLVDEGVQIKKGELLVELDASKLKDLRVDQEIYMQNAEAAFVRSRESFEVAKNTAQSNLDAAELRLKFANEDIQKYEEGEYPNLLKKLESLITLADEEVQRSDEQLKWSKILFNEKYISESELKADELANNKAKLNAELAKSDLALAKEYTYTRTLERMQSEIKQAGMSLERIQRNGAADLVQAEADLKAKEAEFKRQQGKLEKLLQQIERCRIVAPTDGLVIYATSARVSNPWHRDEPLNEGQEVRERQELIYLPTASTFKVNIKIHESSLKKVHPGLPVKVTVDALQGLSFTGRVATIAPLPDGESMFMNPDLKVYDTEVHIETGSDVLKTGMTCKVEVIIEQFPSALYVPMQCVVRVQGKTTVFVESDKGPEPRAVEIGLDNNRMVMILKGLRPGEKVLLSPPLADAESSQQEGPIEEGGESRPSGDAGPQKATEAPAKVEGPGTVSDGASGAGPSPDAGMKAGPGPDNLTDEQRQKMKERLESMSPEERESMRKRWEGMSPEERKAMRESHSGQPSEGNAGAGGGRE